MKKKINKSMENVIKEAEKKLFDEIQTLVEELPWDHLTNQDYFLSCVHEAAHGVVYVRVCQDLGNPDGVHTCKFEVNIKDEDCPVVKSRTYGYAVEQFKSENQHHFLFSPIPAFIRQLCSMAGCIITDEFYSRYYGWKKVRGISDLNTEYGAWSDTNKSKRLGLFGTALAGLTLRISYNDPLVRLTHLRLIRDILKGHGELTIDPRTYLK